MQLVIIDSLVFPFLAPRSIGEARRNSGRLTALLHRLALWGGVAVVTNVERDGRVYGDPYLSMWVDKRVRLSLVDEGVVEACLSMPRGARRVRLRICEEGVLDF